MGYKSLYFFRGLRLKVAWKKTITPVSGQGIIVAGQPIGLFNYGLTYASPPVDLNPPKISTVDIKGGQPIGLINYGVTYANDVK